MAFYSDSKTFQIYRQSSNESSEGRRVRKYFPFKQPSIRVIQNFMLRILKSLNDLINNDNMMCVGSKCTQEITFLAIIELDVFLIFHDVQPKEMKDKKYHCKTKNSTCITLKYYLIASWLLELISVESFYKLIRVCIVRTECNQILVSHFL